VPLAKDRLAALAKNSAELSPRQFALVERFVALFRSPCDFKIGPCGSDIVNETVLVDFGDTLRLHHCLSTAPFSKDKFEHGLAAALDDAGIPVESAPRGNPGYDIKIRGVKTSLKTQADRNIRADSIHVSKWMELGKGTWGENLHDLEGLRTRLFKHMEDYDRIFTLRALRQGTPDFLYELVEIPKALIMRAKDGKLSFAPKTKQAGSRPGYCTVQDASGKQLFQLYFDGGSERKLQVKHLLKEACQVHATWQFKGLPQTKETESETLLELDPGQA
jgi:hypothetical protein